MIHGTFCSCQLFADFICQESWLIDVVQYVAEL